MKLNNGLTIPIVAFGTYNVSKSCEKSDFKITKFNCFKFHF